MMLYAPVLKKYWKQHELWDGTYTITDLLDIYEAICVDSMNTSYLIEYEIEKSKAEAEFNNNYR